MMKEIFEVAGGSIVGTRHVKTGKNNQDAFIWRQTDDFTIAVVADGCGSGKFSEVGSRIGIQFFLDRFMEAVKCGNSIKLSLELSRQLILKDLKSLIWEITRQTETIKEYFLFTLVGAVVMPDYSATFHIGDGVICENEKVIEIGPFTNNQPPYIAYGLFEQVMSGFSLNDLRFSVHSVIRTADVQSILIGTDGIADLIRAENEKIPGREELAGPLNRFWKDDLYFRNPDAVRRRLTIINRQSTKIDWEKREVEKEEGLLPDDTTLIAIRRKKTGGEKDGYIFERE